jgi:hypothetical protein
MEEISDFDKLLLSGVIEPAALDSNTGEMLYTFSKNLEETNPALHKLVIDNFYKTSIKLWELGFLNMDITNSNPLVALTPFAFNENKINQLDEDLQFALSEIKRGLNQ